LAVQGDRFFTDLFIEIGGTAGIEFAGIAELLERSRVDGPIRNAPLAFVVAIMNSLSDATMDFMAQDPANADRHRALGFEALWRVVS
jgi:hypothetical protein